MVLAVREARVDPGGAPARARPARRALEGGYLVPERLRCRARRVARVVHAETARVCPGALTLTDDASPCGDHHALARACALALLSKVSLSPDL